MMKLKLASSKEIDAITRIKESTDDGQNGKSSCIGDPRPRDVMRGVRWLKPCWEELESARIEVLPILRSQRTISMMRKWADRWCTEWALLETDSMAFYDEKSLPDIYSI
ncbi:unnamed protein product [Bursaphelenchus xylophilus]|uniref:(pine wood nematode) hypothetical protein n=1 Tax=Bursaphelenchus xylophilus TaxID=6326 RepID=A0A811K8B8_BURXY|nr:unnamed protein product [Bursaphelenchus xylophilus]CAG9089613.1 unnamed protein product [Bursaphelenchus xylophilus]